MNITIIAVGKLKELAFKEIEVEYLKRLKGFDKFKISIIELTAEKPSKTQTSEQVKTKEANRIKNTIPKDSIIWALDEKGQLWNSVQFSQNLFSIIPSHLTIIIGGHLGLHQNIKEKSHKIMSLSPLTFTHQMVRPILLEQIYRATCIKIGKKYHR